MKNDKKKLILPLFLGFILVASAFGVVVYGFGSNSGNGAVIKYNNQRFVAAGKGSWSTKIGANDLIFAYNPAQVEAIAITPLPTGSMNSGRKIYVTYDPQQNLANTLMEAQNNLLPFFSLQPFRACTKDVPGCSNLPLKTCEDATPSEAIILIEEAETLSTSFDNNCYVMKGPDKELAMVVDKMAFNLLGIMN